jgi:hypothetical protein
MNSILRKLGVLEENVVSNIPNPDETYISIHNEAEKELHSKAEQIRKNLANQTALTIDDLLNPKMPLIELNKLAKQEMEKFDPDALEIVNKSHDIMQRRVIDLFIGSQTSIYPEHKGYFTERLMWFLSEFQEYVNQQTHATIIEQSAEYEANLNDDDAPDLVDDYFNTQRDTFTLESWDKFFDVYILPLIRKHVLEEKLKEEIKQI